MQDSAHPEEAQPEAQPVEEAQPEEAQPVEEAQPEAQPEEEAQPEVPQQWLPPSQCPVGSLGKRLPVPSRLPR